jgi:long-chain acyl-CoA synthetase
VIRTIADLFYAALQSDLPDAFAHRVDDHYQPISHREVQTQVERLALAMHARGLRVGDRVAILSENRPEWAFADYACALSGLVSVPLYPTLTPEQTADILRDSGARWVLCSSTDHLAKVRQEWPRLPELECAVCMESDAQEPSTIAWAQLLFEGEAYDARRADVRAWASERQPGDLLTIIYTSGTTGDPKGAMLSHGNVVSNILACLEILHPEESGRCLSMLPLSHIFERMAGHYLMFHCRLSIYYVKSLQALARDMAEVRPTVILAVPRVFEKIYNKVRDASLSGGWLRHIVFRWSVGLGRKRARYEFVEKRPPVWLHILAGLADHLVFARIRAATGGQIHFAISGGAPLGPRMLEFFWATGIRVYEGYGLTETSPVLALNRPGRVKPGFVGHPILETWEGKPFLKRAEDGELLCRGPNVMLGYWKNEVATKEAIDAEDYFHTGDVCEVDEDGRIQITDRKKEILVTSGGKNVAPQPIENLLRSDRYINQAILVGDRRNFIGALIVPYFPILQRWALYKRLTFRTDAELAALPEAHDKILRRVERLNEGLSNFERVRKVVLLDQELTPESGLLTPSMKIKRRAVYAAFADRIDHMYAENGITKHEDP